MIDCWKYNYSNRLWSYCDDDILAVIFLLYFLTRFQ